MLPKTGRKDCVFQRCTNRKVVLQGGLELAGQASSGAKTANSNRQGPDQAELTVILSVFACQMKAQCRSATLRRITGLDAIACGFQGWMSSNGSGLFKPDAPVAKS